MNAKNNLPHLLGHNLSNFDLGLKIIGGFLLIGLGIVHPNNIVGFLSILAGVLVFTEL